MGETEYMMILGKRRRRFARRYTAQEIDSAIKYLDHELRRAAGSRFTVRNKKIARFLGTTPARARGILELLTAIAKAEGAGQVDVKSSGVILLLTRSDAARIQRALSLLLLKAELSGSVRIEAR